MDSVGLECVNGTVVETNIYTARTVITIVALSLLNIAVVFGNSLVILAVITTRKLRTVTNIFIVSLACADLFLGFAVLPFSISVEVLQVWLWGDVWCSIWLAIDVWLCTASILSLCAISLDRYVAVTQPIRYPSLVSPIRGKILVTGVWVLSFVICLPPLLGWNDLDDESQDKFSSNGSTENASYAVMNSEDIHGVEASNSSNYNLDELLVELFLANMSALLSNSSECNLHLPICELTTTKGYRIYAANGSFFIPMLVMVFFYFRIYMAAMKTANSLRKGVLTTKTSNELHQSSSTGDEAIQLRVHRGGSNKASVRFSSPHNSRRHKHRDPSGCGSLSPNIPNRSDVSVRERLIKDKNKNNAGTKKQIKHSITFKRPIGMRWGKENKRKKGDGRMYLDATEMDVLNSNKTPAVSNGVTSLTPDDRAKDASHHASAIRKAKMLLKETKSSINTKGHARKFRRETKAAKTVAIIVGAFIVCWMPFFTIYLIGAFCQDCVGPLVFSIFFWLGYCNSALNPCIYALFARDFRFAFKRLLFCQRRRGFNRAARADYVTGTRKLTVPVQESDSISDY